MLIREIRISDAESFIELVKKVESDAAFMLMGAGERRTTVEQQQKQLERIGSQENATIFVAEQDGECIGYVMAIGGRVSRTQHVAYIVVGIVKAFRGLGVGTRLFQHLEEWALCHGISRLELTVVTENEPGVALYKKQGFEVEGIKRNSLRIDGVYYNEYFMSKLL